jgi:MFS family permease
MDVPGPRQGGIAGETETPWAALAGVIATVSVFAIAQGLSYPLLSFILERQGTSSALIGLSAAMTPLGMIASASVIPSLGRRFGAGTTALTCAGLAAMLLALIGWTQDLLLWFPLRLLLGAAITPLFVLSEVWVLALAPPSRRGRVIGIYTAIIGAGFAAGPLSLIVVGTQGWPPFLVGITAFIFCGICLASVLPRLPTVDDGGTEASVWSFVTHAPVLLLAVIVAAAFEQGTLSLLPIYGLRYGLGEASMSALLSVLIAGNIALQVPLGLAVDWLAPRSLLIACSVGTALGCLMLPFVIGTALQWPLVLVWGALSYGIYTVALVELGERFSGSMLVAGNAAFALTWGLGGLAGPPATGAVMDAAGIQGLPVTLGLLCSGLAAVAFIRR